MPTGSEPGPTEGIAKHCFLKQQSQTVSVFHFTKNTATTDCKQKTALHVYFKMNLVELPKCAQAIGSAFLAYQQLHWTHTEDLSFSTRSSVGALLMNSNFKATLEQKYEHCLPTAASCVTRHLKINSWTDSEQMNHLFKC